MLVDDVIARISANVPAIAGRTRGAAELTDLVKRGALPNKTPCAFVLPLGLQGGEPDVATGIFRQQLDELIGVVIVVESAGDDTGARGLPPIDTIVRSVVNAVCGWAPGDQVGVFRLERGQLLSLAAGTIIYQLNFALGDQLRIAT